MALEAVVLFKYKKQHEDELNMKKGEVITDVKQVGDGWCEGVLNGVRGMFPDNFVKIQPASTSKPSLLTPATASPDTSSTLRKKSQSKPPQDQVEWVKVTFDYTAEQPDELSVEVGEVLEVVSKEVDEEGWWKVRKGKQTGLVPDNFVKVLSPQPLQSKHSAGKKKKSKSKPQEKQVEQVKPPSKMSTNSTPKKRVPSPSVSEKSQSKPPQDEVERVKVTFDYTAEQPDELSVEVGEVLEVVSKEVDEQGWWKVRKGKQTGLVPDNFVKVLSPQPLQSKHSAGKKKLPSSDKSSTKDYHDAEARARHLQQSLDKANIRVKVLRQSVDQANTKVEDLQQRLKEAEHRAEDAERRANTQIEDLQQRLQEAEQRAEEAERRAHEAQQKAREEPEPSWLVHRDEINLTEVELGRGGWGVVKVATFRGARIAAKCLYGALNYGYWQDVFSREMNMAAQIRHPNLLQFIGATLQGELIILTELMPTSLRAVLETAREPLPYEQISTIGLGIARALNYLHLMQPNPLIHRDISSANVLLEPQPNDSWKAKVSDYGSVNLLENLHTVGPGSPVYAAPEASIPPLQSPKMDIFSFGVLLVEMCTARFPEVVNRERLIQSIQQPDMVALIRQCLAKDRDARPSAGDIITELSRQHNT